MRGWGSIIKRGNPYAVGIDLGPDPVTRKRRRQVAHRV
jgi:hypothetical protein